MRFIISIFFLTVVLSISAFSQKAVILEVSGDWQLNGAGNDLRIGDSFSASSNLRRRNPQKGDSIVVADANGQILKTCSADCLITVPADSDEENSVLAPLIRWWRGNPKTRAKGGVRGNKSPAFFLRNGVVKLTDDRANFTHLKINDNEKKIFFLRFRSVNSAEDFGEWSKTFAFDANDDLVIENIQPGLYEVVEQKTSGAFFFRGTNSAFILVCSPESYAAKLKSFQNLTNVSQKWGRKVKPETVNLFIQTELLRLAKED